MTLFEKYLQEQNISKEDMATKSPEEAGNLLSGWLEQLSKNQKTQFEDHKKAVEKQLKDLGIEVSGLKNQDEDKEFVDEFVKFVQDNKDTIKAIKEQGHGILNFSNKAVDIITTGNSSNVGTVPTLYGKIDGFNFKETFVQDLITNSSTNQPNYTYTEVVPKDGDYTFLAEGETKPQIDFEMETRFAKAYKIAAWEKITEEAMDDIPQLRSLALDLLARKHDLKKQRGLLTGTGVGNEIPGMTSFGRAFNAGDMANQVENPTITDVIGASIVDIASTHNYQDEMPYKANVVMMNVVEYFLKFQAIKEDSDTRKSLYPLSGSKMGDVKIIPTDEIPFGKILVCDAKTYRHVAYKPYSVRLGWVNDDFIKNQFIILAESRFFGFVKRLDQQAYIYDDIATIEAALLKPAV